MHNKLTAVIDRIEGDNIVLAVSGGQDLYWPKNAIDFDYSIGDAVNLILTKEAFAPADSEDKEKNILRRIFQPNPNA